MNSENPTALRKNSKFATKSQISQKSQKLLLLAVEGLRDLPNLPFSEEWVNRINIPKREDCRKWNWFKRIHPKLKIFKLRCLEVHWK